VVDLLSFLRRTPLRGAASSGSRIGLDSIGGPIVRPRNVAMNLPRRAAVPRRERAEPSIHDPAHDGAALSEALVAELDRADHVQHAPHADLEEVDLEDADAEGAHHLGDIDERDETAAAPDAYDYLAAYGIEKSFGGRKVVKGVNLYVRRGECVGLLGPNGAGKTTAFYMITGLIAADAGRIELDGHNVSKLPMYQRARLGIGYLPQEASIFRGLNVEDNIRAVLEVVEPNKAKREHSLDALLKEFNITRLRKTPTIALSGGERRRVEIARALATRPNYMLLDEPFAGIDPIAVGDIQMLVRHLTNRGIGVLITDHNVRETLGLTDRAYIIYSGEVLMEGSSAEIINNPDVRRLYLGEDFRM
jgi:lipopolysaccharide export system ATP-binding protein